MSDFTHNTDLFASDAELSHFDPVAAVLRYPAALQLFQEYDAAAAGARRRTLLLGYFAVALGAIALYGAVAELFLPSLGYALYPASIVVLELCGFASVACGVAVRFEGNRNRWLIARFMTEQIRQWIFQSLLDGEYVSLAGASPSAFEVERERRWNELVATARIAKGAMATFVDGNLPGLHHQRTSYHDPGMAAVALRAYNDLRFDRQLAYLRVRRDSLLNLDRSTEALSRWALFTALILATVHTTLALLAFGIHPVAPAILHSCAAAALCLAVSSAMIHACRSGLAISEEYERCESKWTRLLVLQSQFRTATTVEAGLEIVSEAETTLVDELREFVRQHRNASFLL